MLAFLPLIVLILLVRSMYSYLGATKPAVLAGAVAWGVLLTTITELLSAFEGLTRQNIIISWAVCAVVLTTAIMRRKRGGPVFRIRRRRGRRSAARYLVYVIYAFVLTLAFIALVAPPNTWDSMTYHMSRVMHWIQNASVAHYPTNIPRQLELAPAGEYIILHLQVLSGGDRLANLPQWFAMVGSLLAMPLIAARLGAESLGKLLAVAFCLSIPMGVLQSTSSQNDYVFAFWLVCSTWLLLELSNMGSPFGITAASALFGTAFGLALLTKTIAFLYGPPMLIWFALTLWKRAGIRAWRPAVMAACLALSINSRFFYRNWQVFGWPLGERSLARDVSNTSPGPRILASNLIRSLAVHTNLPIPGAREAATYVARTLVSAIGVDPDDPGSTYPGCTFRVHGPFHFEDVAGCGAHLGVIVICLVLSIRSGVRTGRLLGYAAVWVSAFMIFCLYLRWQPWHSRLHLPLFVLFSPFIGTILSRSLHRRAQRGIFACLVLAALPYVVFNQSRPLVGLKNPHRNLFALGRRDLLFFNRPDLKIPYEQAARQIAERRCDQIGLAIGNDDWEYAFWRVLQETDSRPHLIRHVDVRNASAKMQHQPPFDDSHPCIFAVWEAPDRIHLFEPDAYRQRVPR